MRVRVVYLASACVYFTHFLSFRVNIRGIVSVAACV